MQLPSRKNLVTRWIKKILLRGEKIPPPVRKNWRYFFSDCILGTRGQHLKISTQLSPVWQSTLLMDTPPLPSLKQGWIIFVTSQATYHTVYIYIYIMCAYVKKRFKKHVNTASNAWPSRYHAPSDSKDESLKTPSSLESKLAYRRNPPVTCSTRKGNVLKTHNDTIRTCS